MLNSKLHNGHLPQLDSLRSFAVLLVISSHWFAKDHFLNRFFDNGILGVTLFFVLSGYLITGILLRSKNAVFNGSSLKDAYKTFYIRRSLRIFPVYYLLIFVLLLFNMATIRGSFFWHFFYLSNFYFWMQGHFGGSLSHFWSLAVEEQFYILWPAIIFLIPRLKLPAVFICGIALAIIFRLAMYHPPHQMGRFLMPGSLDSFCLGALLVYGQQYFPPWFSFINAHRNKFLLLFLSLFLVMQWQVFFHYNDVFFLAAYLTTISLLFAQLIHIVSLGVKQGPFAPLLNNPLLIYLGKISYGIYLFHNFIPYLYGLELPSWLEPFSIYVAQFLRLLVLVGIASVSWYLIERPILQMKKRFEYTLKAA